MEGERIHVLTRKIQLLEVVAKVEELGDNFEG